MKFFSLYILLIVALLGCGKAANISQLVNGQGEAELQLKISSRQLGDVIAEESYTDVVIVEGGVRPFKFVASSSANSTSQSTSTSAKDTAAAEGLPAGLTLDEKTGVLSGQVEKKMIGKIYTVTITVSDNAGAVEKKDYDLKIVDKKIDSKPLAFLNEELPAILPQIAYVANALVTGGLPPYTFKLESGSLPSGLALDTSTGIISGTAANSTAGASYGFSIKVTDVFGATLTQVYYGKVGSLHVPIEAMSFPITTLPQPTPRISYQVYMSVTGGKPPLSYALDSGSTLPLGLSLNASTGLISGTPADSTSGQAFSFSVVGA